MEVITNTDSQSVENSPVIETLTKIFTEKERQVFITYKDISKFSSPEEEFEYEQNNLVTCRICKLNKPLFNFQNNTSGRQPFGADGLRLKRKECKDCTRKEAKGKQEAVKLAKSMGLPYKAPEGTCCEMCGATEKIVFDHDHNTNEFRGWLCDPCNRSLGVLGDNVESLLKYINYLQKTEKKSIVFNYDGTLGINK